VKTPENAFPPLPRKWRGIHGLKPDFGNGPPLWLIAERAWDEGGPWPCFAPGLATTMTDFTSSIV
jgi:hypothetical protein